MGGWTGGWVGCTLHSSRSLVRPTSVAIWTLADGEELALQLRRKAPPLRPPGSGEPARDVPPVPGDGLVRRYAGG